MAEVTLVMTPWLTDHATTDGDETALLIRDVIVNGRSVSAEKVEIHLRGDSGVYLAEDKRAVSDFLSVTLVGLDDEDFEWLTLNPEDYGFGASKERTDVLISDLRLEKSWER